jgi:hypothetical protein
MVVCGCAWFFPSYSRCFPTDLDWQPCAGIGCGASVTIRGSGFQSATRATLGVKQAFVTCKDMNTLSPVTPTLSPGPQQLILINPDGESLAFHAVFFAQ